MKRNGWTCGFWRRVGALLIDSLILTALGFILGLLLSDMFVLLGNRGWFIGTLISLCYFVLMNSYLFHGQTLGKRVLSIRVVRPDGALISLPRSLLRYGILASPGMVMPLLILEPSTISGPTQYLFALICGSSLALTSLFLFNRRTRQTLHDLIAGTCVINTRAEPQPLPAIWTPNLIISALMMAVASASMLQFSVPEATTQRLVRLQQAVQQHAATIDASVKIGQLRLNAGDSEATASRYMDVQVRMKLDPLQLDNRRLAAEIAQILLETDADARNQDLIQITLSHGYSIGIYQQWQHDVHQFGRSELAMLQ